MRILTWKGEVGNTPFTSHKIDRKIDLDVFGTRHDFQNRNKEKSVLTLTNNAAF